MKRENDTKDRFIEYLKTSEGTEYLTIGESVKTRSGVKDFDYLLQNSSGDLLALEITCFTEPEELSADAMRQEIMQVLSPLLPTEGFSGFFMAYIP